MTVDPGFYGSPFVEDVLDKMTDFHYVHPHIPLQVDGGINEETAKKAVEAGATILSSGSYIFKSDDIGEAIYMLQRVED
jgi:ribulose-phosphate 3-epimerase